MSSDSSPPSSISLTPVPGPKPEPRGESQGPTRDLGTRPRVIALAPTMLSPETAAESPTSRVSAGMVIGDKFRLVERLGAGGFGEVYRAEHLTLGTDVAIKIMHPRLAMMDELARRFRREAYAASLLKHRNVVKVLDFGDSGGFLFLVMEHLVGEPLGRWIDQRLAPPPLADVVDIMDQVLDAFTAAHAAGVVHRDLKSDNVFLTVEADGKRVVKVVDFGLAHVDDPRDAGPTLTKPEVVSGTPAFMSPEQCRSLAVGPSTDLYAMGCLLTELLQLRPPFRGGAFEIITQQMFVEPPPLERPEGAEPVPPLLERLRLSLLAKTPEQRPPDVQEVKRLFAEATNREAAARRLPPRKSADLDARDQGRGTAGPRRQAVPNSEVRAVVKLVQYATGAHGVTASCKTGLAAQGVALVDVDAGDPAVQVVLVDAGGEIDLAAAWLRQKGLRVPVIVCLDGVTTERINLLIAAGAKDIVPYPVTSDVLVRKLRRLLPKTAAPGA